MSKSKQTIEQVNSVIEKIKESGLLPYGYMKPVTEEIGMSKGTVENVMRLNYTAPEIPLKVIEAISNYSKSVVLAESNRNEALQSIINK